MDQEDDVVVPGKDGEEETDTAEIATPDTM